MGNNHMYTGIGTRVAREIHGSGNTTYNGQWTVDNAQ